MEAKLVFPYKAGWDLADWQEAEVSSCADPNKTLEAHLFLLLCFTGPTKETRWLQLVTSLSWS